MLSVDGAAEVQVQRERAESTAAKLKQLESELAASESQLGAMARSQVESVAKAASQLQEIAQLQAELYTAHQRTDSSGRPGAKDDRSSGGDWSPSASSADESEPPTPWSARLEAEVMQQLQMDQLEEALQAEAVRSGVLEEELKGLRAELEASSEKGRFQSAFARNTGAQAQAP